MLTEEAYFSVQETLTSPTRVLINPSKNRGAVHYGTQGLLHSFKVKRLRLLAFANDKVARHLYRLGCGRTPTTAPALVLLLATHRLRPLFYARQIGVGPIATGKILLIIGSILVDRIAVGLAKVRERP